MAIGWRAVNVHCQGLVLEGNMRSNHGDMGEVIYVDCPNAATLARLGSGNTPALVLSSPTPDMPAAQYTRITSHWIAFRPLLFDRVPAPLPSRYRPHAPSSCPK